MKYCSKSIQFEIWVLNFQQIFTKFSSAYRFSQTVIFIKTISFHWHVISIFQWLFELFGMLRDACLLYYILNLFELPYDTKACSIMSRKTQKFFTNGSAVFIMKEKRATTKNHSIFVILGLIISTRKKREV